MPVLNEPFWAVVRIPKRGKPYIVGNVARLKRDAISSMLYSSERYNARKWAKEGLKVIKVIVQEATDEQ